MKQRLLTQAFLSILLFCTGVYVMAQELHSYAIVEDDGSLLIQGRRVHLFGIHMVDNADSSAQCQNNVRSESCVTRAVFALDSKVQGFLRCYTQTENEDKSLNSICYVGRSSFEAGEDLGAYLIKEGWALALPAAPAEYHALERIARHHKRGVWGFPVD